MFRVLFLSMATDDPFEQHNFDLLDESFVTKDEAKKFIIDELVEQDKADFIDGDEEIEENAEFNLENYETEIVHEVFSYGDLVYRNEYKIVEVK